MRRLLAAILFNSACASSPRGELVDADVVVPREGAKALAAKFSMVAGDLRIHGGDCELAQAKMRYDAASSVPEIDFAIDEQGFGTLHVREDGTRARRNAAWTVCLTRALPVELEIDLGAGNSEIALAGVQLRTLDVDIGAGDVDVDLRRSILAATRVSIDGGAGNLHLALPPGVGVRVDADKGIGSISAAGLHEDAEVLVNDQWGHAELSVDVHIDLGAGEISVTSE
jgi:hypothetical protein